MSYGNRKHAGWDNRAAAASPQLAPSPPAHERLDAIASGCLVLLDLALVVALVASIGFLVISSNQGLERELVGASAKAFGFVDQVVWHQSGLRDALITTANAAMSSAR